MLDRRESQNTIGENQQVVSETNTRTGESRINSNNIDKTASNTAASNTPRTIAEVDDDAIYENMIFPS